MIPNDEREAQYLALKRQLAAVLIEETEGLSQTWAAAWMHVRQGSVSELRRGKLDRLSLEWFIRAAQQLGYDVTITTKRRVPKSKPTEWPAPPAPSDLLSCDDDDDYDDSYDI